MAPSSRRIRRRHQKMARYGAFRRPPLRHRRTYLHLTTMDYMTVMQFKSMVVLVPTFEFNFSLNKDSKPKNGMTRIPGIYQPYFGGTRGLFLIAQLSTPTFFKEWSFSILGARAEVNFTYSKKFIPHLEFLKSFHIPTIFR